MDDEMPAAEAVTAISVDELLGRAVRSGRKVRGSSSGELRWVRVMRLFALGSNSAQQLCRAYGVDPDDRIAKRR